MASGCSQQEALRVITALSTKSYNLFQTKLFRSKRPAVLFNDQSGSLEPELFPGCLDRINFRFGLAGILCYMLQLFNGTGFNIGVTGGIYLSSFYILGNKKLMIPVQMQGLAISPVELEPAALFLAHGGNSALNGTIHSFQGVHFLHHFRDGYRRIFYDGGAEFQGGGTVRGVVGAFGVVPVFTGLSTR